MATTLDVLDENQIQTAVTSITSPGVWVENAKTAAQIARTCNEYSAGMVRDHPTRFGSFAILPVPDMDAALAELAYALDELHLDGVVLLTNSGDVMVGDDRMRPLFEELNRRKTVVFLHPTDPVGYDEKIMGLPSSMIEYVADTARGVVGLMLSGVLEDFPDITFIVSHGGGVLPYLAKRISIYEEPSMQLFGKAPRGTYHYLRQLHYDIAMSVSPMELSWLAEFVGTDHITYGTDYPMMHRDWVKAEETEFDSLTVFSEQMTEQINSGTARTLFPRIDAAWG